MTDTDNVAGEDQLHFGALDAGVALHWRTAGCEDTPMAAARHAPSQTVMLLTRSAGGRCSLRLMHSSTLEQVRARIPMRTGIS